jgi:hypothetical protein
LVGWFKCDTITFKLCYVWDPRGWTIGLSVDQLLLTEPTEQGGQPPAASPTWARLIAVSGDAGADGVKTKIVSAADVPT